MPLNQLTIYNNKPYGFNQASRDVRSNQPIAKTVLQLATDYLQTDQSELAKSITLKGTPNKQTNTEENKKNSEQVFRLGNGITKNSNSSIENRLQPYKGDKAYDLQGIKRCMKAGDWQGVIDLISIGHRRLLGGKLENVSFRLRKSTSASPASYHNSVVSIYPKAFQAAVKAGFLLEKDILNSGLIIIAHELTHAWQDQNTNLLNHPENEAIYEGHAVFMQTLFARLVNIEDVNERGIELQMNPDYWNSQYSDPEEAQMMMEKHIATRFQSAMIFFDQYQQGGMPAIKPILTDITVNEGQKRPQQNRPAPDIEVLS